MINNLDFSAYEVWARGYRARFIFTCEDRQID
jgi:hypothetical protein